MKTSGIQRQKFITLIYIYTYVLIVTCVATCIVAFFNILFSVAI